MTNNNTEKTTIFDASDNTNNEKISKQLTLYFMVECNKIIEYPFC